MATAKVKTATASDGFVTCSKSAYPYETVHSATCGTAKRAKWGRPTTLDALAQTFERLSMRPNVHACLEGSPAIADVYRAAGALHEKHLTEQRRNHMVEALAIARLAVVELESHLGNLSAAEQDTAHRVTEHLVNRTWAPKQHDVLRYLIPAVKPPDW